MCFSYERVLEVTPGKQIAWSYTRLRDNPHLVNAYSASRLPNGNTLIVDRRADFVIEVTPDKRLVWQYGATPNSLQPGSLFDPFSAQRLSNGNTLIVDNRGGTRVIEVRNSDYSPTAPSLGYTADSIVWQYGIAGSSGLGDGQLASPRHAQRLANGDTLITDSGDQVTTGNRVMEVTPAGAIARQFGVAGEAGTHDGLLDRPSAAQRLSNGNTVIVEEDGLRMLEVAPSGEIVEQYRPGDFPVEGGATGKLRSIHRTTSGPRSDQEGARRRDRLSASGTVTSDKLWLGLPA
jgi:hypothetical protein